MLTSGKILKPLGMQRRNGLEDIWSFIMGFLPMTRSHVYLLRWTLKSSPTVSFRGYRHASPATVDTDVISIDGKTLRHSYDSVNAKSVIHIVSAWAYRDTRVLGDFRYRLVYIEERVERTAEHLHGEVTTNHRGRENARKGASQANAYLPAGITPILKRCYSLYKSLPSSN